MYEKLLEDIKKCNSCIRTTHKCLPYGNLLTAKFMFIGLSPGYSKLKLKGYIDGVVFQLDREKQTGASMIFKKMINKLKNFCDFENDVYVTNLVKCAVKGQTPVASTLFRCRQFLTHEILIGKNIEKIVCMGSYVAKNYFDISDKIYQEFEFCINKGNIIKVKYVEHPNYILRRQTKYDNWEKEILKFLINKEVEV